MMGQSPLGDHCRPKEKLSSPGYGETSLWERNAPTLPSISQALGTPRGWVRRNSRADVLAHVGMPSPNDPSAHISSKVPTLAWIWSCSSPSPPHPATSGLSCFLLAADWFFRIRVCGCQWERKSPCLELGKQ